MTSMLGRGGGAVVDERACGMESETISCAASATSMVFFALKVSVSSSPPR
jgi:hypothetical protein